MTVLDEPAASPTGDTTPRSWLSATPPPFLERAVTGVTMLLLLYSLPLYWFREASNDDGVVVTSDLYSTVVFPVLIGGLCLRLTGAWRRPLAALRAEPFLALFLVILVCSPLWAESFGFTFRKVLSLAFTSLFGFYLIARYRSRDVLHMVALVLCVGTVLDYLWVFAYPARGIEGSDQWAGVWGIKNTLGQIAGLGAFTLVVAARVFRRQRVIFYTFALLEIGLVIGSKSATAWVGTTLLFGLLAVFVTFRARRTLYGSVVLSLLGATVAAGLVATRNLEVIAGWVGKDVTLTGRIPLWQDLWQYVLDRPLLGVGYGSFWNGWFSPAHEIWVEYWWLPPSGHNVLLDLLLTLGLVGTVPFLVMFVRTVHRSILYLRDRADALGLYPLMFVSFVLLWSMTNTNLLSRNLVWPLLIYQIGVVAGVTPADPAPDRSARLVRRRASVIASRG